MSAPEMTEAETWQAKLQYDAATRAYELRELLFGWHGISHDVKIATIRDALDFCERIASAGEPA